MSSDLANPSFAAGTPPPAQQKYPTLDPHASSNDEATDEATGETTGGMTGNSTVDGAADSVKKNASSAMDSVKNSQTAQTITQGPMADKARAERDTTKNEFANLASSRQTPTTQTANGQHLTHYHSFFYNLLKWDNPRATAISYLAAVVFIFAWRYVPMVKYSLKLSYIVLGATATAEVAGKMIFGQGFASKMRPRKYYTLPRETVESMVEDLTELVNFFVIEFQRIVFAENVWATIAAFTTTLVTYLLIKVTPAWGLALLFTTIGYFVPLAYIRNQKVIDEHLSNAQQIIDRQTGQMRDVAAQHTNKAMGMGQDAFKDYSARASEMMGGAKKQAVDKGYAHPETADKVPGQSVKKDDFPAAPTQAPVSGQHDGVSDDLTGAGEKSSFGESQKTEQEPLLG